MMRYINLVFFFLICVHAVAQNEPTIFNVEDLNGANGFKIEGLQQGSQFGAESKFIGDINNDGLEDIAFGVNNADIDTVELAGATYVLFGTRNGFAAEFDLNSLDGTNGFAIHGDIENRRLGNSVEGVGDINGDGIDDLVVDAQDVMVLYGRTNGFSAVMTFDSADFKITGHRTSNEVGRLGDVNGDDINDFVISNSSGGDARVIFGQDTDFPEEINGTWFDGEKGFTTQRYGNSSRSAYLAGGAGDVNNDGFNDIFIGDWKLTSGDDTARTHLLFGRPSFTGSVDLEALEGRAGFTVDHTGGNFLAFTGSLGDINNDGISDFFQERSMLFGREQLDSFPAHIPFSSVEDGTFGFTIPGNMVSAAIGDINGDGIDDFINYGSNVYVIYGSEGGFPNAIVDSVVTDDVGFKVEEIRSSNIGRPVSGGGDFNGDGIDDFVVGSPGYQTSQGAAYVFFGGSEVITGIPGNEDFGENKDLFHFYPNPVTNGGCIHITSEEEVTVTVDAVDGQNHRSARYHSGEKVCGLSRGMYIISARSEKYVTIEKIIVN